MDNPKDKDEKPVGRREFFEKLAKKAVYIPAVILTLAATKETSFAFVS